MRATVIRSLQARMKSFADLIEQIDEEGLQARLDLPKHKNLVEHLWCVIGARESYTKALSQGEWQGFSCSLNSYQRADFAQALEVSAQALLDVVHAVTEWTPRRDELLMALAEHEVMHEGQMIRHMYALERTLPDSWRWA